MQMEDFKRCPTCGIKNSLSIESCQNCGRWLGNVPVTKSMHSKSTSYPLPIINPVTTPTPSEPLVQQKTVQREKNPLSRMIFLFILCLLLIPIFFLATKIHRNTPNLPITHHSTVPAISLSSELKEIQTPNGDTIGVNDGSLAPFDVWNARSEVLLKQQAAQQLHMKNQATAISLWEAASKIETSDAEALIYAENQRVMESGAPYITLAVGIALSSGNLGGPRSLLQGVYVAQHEYNANSSILKLRILIANAGSEVSYAGLVAEQIAQIASHDSTVVGVIDWLSSRSHAALPSLSRAKIPQVAPQATDDGLTNISPYFFRVVPPNKVQAQAAAIFAESTLHVKNPVVFWDPQDNYSQNLAHDFEGQFAKDGHTNLHEEVFTSGKTKNFSPLIQDAEKYHPDAFYFAGPTSSDTELFQDALPVTGSFATLPVVSGDGGYVAKKNSYNRWYFTTFAFPDEWNILVKKYMPPFFKNYSTDFNPDGLKPGGYYGYTRANDTVILSYDATQVMLQGAQIALTMYKKNTITPQNLSDALSQIKGQEAFQGVSGQIDFGSDHDPINKAVIILRVSANGHIQWQSVEGCFLKGCH